MCLFTDLQTSTSAEIVVSDFIKPFSATEKLSIVTFDLQETKPYYLFWSQAKESSDAQLASLTSQLEREKAAGVEGKAQLLKQVS